MSKDPKAAARAMREFRAYVLRNIDAATPPLDKVSKPTRELLRTLAAKHFDNAARRVRRSTGRKRGHQPGETAIKEDDFRRQFTALMKEFPDLRILDVVASLADSLHVAPKTIERYLQRWQIAKPPHWHKRKASRKR